MENIIKKAIEGGWKERDVIWNEESSEPMRYTENLMDSSFWQALGKACEWNEYCCSECGGKLSDDRSRRTGRQLCMVSSDCWDSSYEQKTYMFNALKFHELNLTEGFDKAVEWLNNLIK